MFLLFGFLESALKFMVKKQKQLNYGLPILVCLIGIIAVIGVWFVSEMNFGSSGGRSTGSEENFYSQSEELKFDTPELLDPLDPIEKIAEKIESMEFGEWLNFQTKFPKTFEGIKNLW